MYIKHFDIGVRSNSRNRATAIIDYVSDEMIRKIISEKISVLIDESTTSKSMLIVYSTCEFSKEQSTHFVF